MRNLYADYHFKNPTNQEKKKKNPIENWANPQQALHTHKKKLKYEEYIC